MLLTDFERDQLSVGRQGTSQPDAAVAGQRADLEDLFRPAGGGEHLEELALQRGDLDRGHVVVARGLEGGAQGIIFGGKTPFQLGSDGGACLCLLA